MHSVPSSKLRVCACATYSSFPQFKNIGSWFSSAIGINILPLSVSSLQVHAKKKNQQNHSWPFAFQGSHLALFAKSYFSFNTKITTAIRETSAGELSLFIRLPFVLPSRINSGANFGFSVNGKLSSPAIILAILYIVAAHVILFLFRPFFKKISEKYHLQSPPILFTILHNTQPVFISATWTPFLVHTRLAKRDVTSCNPGTLGGFCPNLIKNPCFNNTNKTP